MRWVKDSETRGIAVYVAPGLSINPLPAGGPLYRCVHGIASSDKDRSIFWLAGATRGAIKDDYRECWMKGIPKYGKYLKGEKGASERKVMNLQASDI